jgi:hypothetical protein
MPLVIQILVNVPPLQEQREPVNGIDQKMWHLPTRQAAHLLSRERLRRSLPLLARLPHFYLP